MFLFLLLLRHRVFSAAFLFAVAAAGCGAGNGSRFVAVSSLSPAAPLTRYTAKDIGQFNSRSTTGTALSSSGQIVGQVSASDVDPSFYHAFLYEDGVFQDLGAPGGGTRSFGQALNDRGQFATYTENSPTVYSGYGDGAFTQHAFLYTDGVPQDIGTLGAAADGSGTRTIAQGINNRGQVVGYALSGQQIHAFLYDGAIHDLDTLPGRQSCAYDINEAGQVVGYAVSGGEPAHAFRYENGRMYDIGVLPGKGFSFARAINNRKQIVGESGSVRNQSDAGDLIPLVPDDTEAFLWENNVMRGLGTLGGATSHAAAINDARQVVGTSQTNADSLDHAFAWQNGQMQDLNVYNPLPGGWRRGVAVNSRGQILLSAGLLDKPRANRLVLLTPASAP